MGDRGNIIVCDRDDTVYLYTHWYGSELHNILKSALARGVSRWNDFQYLTRIIFCEMIKDDVMGTTGFGITSQMHDGGTELYVYVDSESVVDQAGREYSFKEFIEN